MDASAYLQLLEARDFSVRPGGIKPLEVKEQSSMYDKLKKIIADSGSDIEFTNDGIVILNYDQLTAAIDDLDNSPSKLGLGYSAIVYGDAGIGKSSILVSLAKKRAADIGREFIRFDDYLRKFPTSDEFTSNIGQYYIFLDIRTASLDKFTMTGIPDVSAVEKYGYIKEMPVPWVAVLTVADEAAGTLFFDEVNQAPPEVQDGLFSVINFLERTIAGNQQIRGNWRIHSAGNWGPGYTINDLSLALKDRFTPYYLKPSFAGWRKFADNAVITLQDGEKAPLIHPLLMEFLESNPDKYFLQPPTDPSSPDKRPNPRNHEKVSALLYKTFGSNYDLDTDITKDTWFRMISQIGADYGKEIARDFEAFCKLNSSIQIEDILADPSKISRIGKSVETDRYQFVTVFKRSFIKDLKQFSSKFRTGDESVKQQIVNKGANYLYALGYLLSDKGGNDESTALEIFSTVFTPDTKTLYNSMINLVIEYFEDKGDSETADWVEALDKHMRGILVGTATAGKRQKAAKKEDEESEATSSMTPGAEQVLKAVSSGRSISLDRFASEVRKLSVPF
jgi:hypothetical protein